MNSRLSSLLVRDGVLGVKRMEQAFQRQVIYGGALDTILIEMAAVPEERLWHYLSLATGLPSADRDLLEYFDPRAVQVCPRELAERYHVAPCALDGQALRCLVVDPVDLGELESLATSLGIPVQPFVVPEYRFHLHLERLFGIATPSRYAALSRKAGYVPQARPAEPSVVVDEGRPGDTIKMEFTPEMLAAASVTVSDGRMEAGGRRTVEISTDALAQQIASEEQKRRAAELSHGAAPGSARAPLDGGQGAATAKATPPASASDAAAQAALPLSQRSTQPKMKAQPAPEPAPPTDKVVVDTEQLRPPGSSASRPAPDLSPAGGVVKAPWRGGATIDPLPLEPRAASELLARADERDVIFALLVRAARSRARFAGLLTVQGGTAFGRVGIDGDQPDGDMAQVAIPLASASALRNAYESGSPYIGPVRTNIPEIDEMLEKMGGFIPPSALVLPLVIRDRTIALLYAHRGADTLSISEVADVLPVVTDAALALSRLIVKAKSAGFRRADTADQVAAAAAVVPAAAVVADELTRKTPAARAGDPGGWAKPSAQAAEAAPPPPALDFGQPAQLAGGAGAPAPIGVLLDHVEAGAEPAATYATEEAMARLDDLLPELARRFPGKLTVDRYAVSGRSPRAAQHGPLLALTLRLGARVVPLLVEKLNSNDREVRYYATICLAEVRAPIAVPGLVGRLFDSDYGVRGAALEALLGYAPRDVDAALDPVRRALRSDSLRARAAAHALGELRDVKAVLDLIDSTERDPTTAAEAHRALVLICKQDFGTKAKKWRKWWEEHRARSRIEWMLEGLAHGDAAVRLSAADELKRLTGEYFGYNHDAPKREREEARQRWLKWWEETGKRRFLRDPAAEEAGRPTGVVPRK